MKNITMVELIKLGTIINEGKVLVNNKSKYASRVNGHVFEYHECGMIKIDGDNCFDKNLFKDLYKTSLDKLMSSFGTNNVQDLKAIIDIKLEKAFNACGVLAKKQAIKMSKVLSRQQEKGCDDLVLIMAQIHIIDMLLESMAY